MPIVCDIINVYANTKNTFFTERINFMILLDELRLELVGCRKEMEELADVLSIKASKERIEELNAETAKDGFWDDLENSQKVLQETKSLERKIEKFNKLNGQLEDVITLIELSIEEEDESSIEEIKAEAEDFKKKLEEEKLSTLLTGEYDNSNAILTFHAGAGGTEAQDWTEMLYRMYNMWAERHDYKVTLMDYLDGDDAGVKSASILIEGENAYGYMKSESGVHRLVRISPFDSSGRRHTSFAALEVMPEIDDSIEVDIRPEDIEMEVYRSSGAGGQKVNKTSSAVRLIHKPTGIVVSCQTQRSQYQNKDYAMKMLVSKLVEIKEREHLEKIEDIKGVQKEIAWGAQIRSYVFMPYTLAKDHRTGHENGNINAVNPRKLPTSIPYFNKNFIMDIICIIHARPVKINNSMIKIATN
jgi:peptide chain release factor 2